MNFFIFLELTKLKNDSIRDIFIHSDIIINLGPNRAQAQDNFNEENDVDDNSPELKEDVEANDVIDIVKAVPVQEETLAPKEIEAKDAASNTGDKKDNSNCCDDLKSLIKMESDTFADRPVDDEENPENVGESPPETAASLDGSDLKRPLSQDKSLTIDRSEISSNLEIEEENLLHNSSHLNAPKSVDKVTESNSKMADQI